MHVHVHISFYSWIEGQSTRVRRYNPAGNVNKKGKSEMEDRSGLNIGSDITIIEAGIIYICKNWFGAVSCVWSVVETS